MALTKCPDCGREISSEATQCPGCGRSLLASSSPLTTATPFEKWGCLVPLLLVGVIALAIILFR
jgi:hypothetical protein